MTRRIRVPLVFIAVSGLLFGGCDAIGGPDPGPGGGQAGGFDAGSFPDTGGGGWGDAGSGGVADVTVSADSSGGWDASNDTGDSDAADAGLPDTTTGPSPWDGTWLLSVGTVIAPELPIQFTAQIALAPADAGTGGTVHLTLQPLQTAPGKATREPVGAPIEVDGVVDEAGVLTVDTGPQQVVGDANPVSGSDIQATLLLTGTLWSETVICGAVDGSVTVPFEAPLTGSTWGAVRIEATDPASLPDPVSACPDEGPGDDVGGAGDDATIGGEDVGGAGDDAAVWQDAWATGEDAQADATPGAPSFAAVWPVLEGYGCSGGYCHGGGAGGLTMADEQGAYDSLVEVASTCDGSLRVAPGLPAQSLLWSKVDPDAEPSCGPKMPYGGDPIDDADAVLIRSWIEGGALP